MPGSVNRHRRRPRLGALRARQQQRRQRRHHEQAGHEIQPAFVAAGAVLDPADHGRAGEAAQVAERVDGGDPGRRAGAAEEGGRHAPQRRLGAADADVDDGQRDDQARDALGAGRHRQSGGGHQAGQDHVPSPLAGAVGMARPQDHGDHRHHRRNRIQVTHRHRRHTQLLDDLGRPDAEGVEAGRSAEIDQGQRAGRMRATNL